MIVWVALVGLLVAALVTFAAVLTVLVAGRPPAKARAPRAWPFDAI